MKRKQKQLHLFHTTEEYYALGVYVTIRYDGKVVSSGFNFGFDRAKRGERSVRDKAIKSSGMCLFCNEIDWRVLVQHHVFGKRIDSFTITLCANCHAILHWNLGGTPKMYSQV